jgi:hypothetical protein
MPTTTVPVGLEVKRYGLGWWISHVASGLPLHSVEYATKREALAGVARVAQLDIDWTGDKDTVRAAAEALPGGMDAVRRLAIPPDELARQQRVYDNSVRYLRALKADGQTVVSKTGHGLAGTIYEMSCGCRRHFTLTIGGMNSGEPTEDLLVRCDRHRDLVGEES